MKLMIDISEEDLAEVKEYGIRLHYTLAKSITNGIPLTEDNDTISRKAVVDMFKTYWRCFVDHDNLELFKDEINKLPIATPTRRKAKWIMTGEKDELYCEIARCSSCGAENINNGVDKFCPDCGAEMERDSDA